MNPAATGCPFCNEAIRSSVFFETKDYLALFNIAPVLPGHSLIIPRLHYTSILQLTEAELAGFFLTARKALHILLQAFNTEAFDWSIQEKPEAGQSIEHLHLHIVPRVKDDLAHPGHWYPLVQKNDMDMIDSQNRPRLTSQEMKIIVEKLREVARGRE
jgi:bis(5'-adenosyl)-triphosphatase